MLKKRIALRLGITLLTITNLVGADVRLTPADPAADRLVAEALQNTPEIAAARATAEAALRRVEPAATLPDPMFSFTYQNETRDITFGEMEGSFLGVMASQTLPWPGKLSLAGAAARSEAREVETGVIGRTQRTIEARVRNGWYDLVLARALDRLIEERRESAKQIEATVRDRYAAGLSVQQDVLRAQVELARLEELKAAQQAAIASRLAELNRLLGQRQDAPIESAADLPTDASVPAITDVINSVIARSPEVAAVRQGIETGRIGVEIAKKNFLPDFVVSGGTMDRGGFEMGPMWQVGVAISLPTWLSRRQNNQLAEAEARLTVRAAQSDLVARELELRTRERLAQLDAALRIAKLYYDQILPLDTLALESSLASYTSGKVPFVSVLEALNVLYNDRALYLGRLAESAKWRVAIDEASLEPSGAMTASAPMPASSGMSSSAGMQSAASGRTRSTNPSMTSMR